MKYRRKTNAYMIILLVALLMTVSPYRSNAQEAFPNQAPSQEFMRNKNPGMNRTGAGTGGFDDWETGTGNDGHNTGFQNDYEAPAKDAIWLLCLLAAGYGIYRRKRITANSKN